MKVLILGDSISEGIGRIKDNYCKILQDICPEYDFKNFSKTGTTVRYIEEINADIKEFNPDILIVFYGNVDALPRPKSDTFLYKLLPNRYKKNGMMNPRAFYSHKKLKRIIQKIDSRMRININKALIKRYGYEQWNDSEGFYECYQKFLSDYPLKSKILISTVPIYEEWFPNARMEFDKYNNIIKQLASNNNCEYINLMNLLNDRVDLFAYDRFHLNYNGYVVLANEINTIINKINGEKNEKKSY